ncbi:hypothetical protein A3F29_02475 [Candidatus Roizmanbacteria bacterium RIFCSPHIGHO2_12_FULL_33_9]|uniref:Uncharacterized protein n=1 Tax=Candidatus Roizmanbacteria bacterium RIFCSPHIGHO2_12_FULL_33_9 TaxID=1802045 RepID=A0A1F7HIL1_9BACT|nr:MAG: hypothetical protein A3F29_02475 [Candidatus Roizmanbacteria bacterium RIFCSPHIGHO2_12_FULL_33_9]
MTLKQLIIIIFILLFSRSFISGFNIQAQEGKKATNPVISNTTVSASIGRGLFSLFGYAPSSSVVTLSGIGYVDATQANRDGYFEFNNQFVPNLPYSEACVTAEDKLGRTTKPVCIPPIPVNKYTEIGPILLPPTISVNKSDYFVGDEVTFSGQSIPNSEISLSLFVNKRSFIPQAYAYSIPEVKAATDNKGNYSITLPSSKSENFRVFSQFKKAQDFSPNSNTLRVKVLPFWMFIWVFLKYLFALFKERIVEIIIISQIIAVAIFITRWYFKPAKIAQQRAIILRKNYPRSIAELIN